MQTNSRRDITPSRVVHGNHHVTFFRSEVGRDGRVLQTQPSEVGAHCIHVAVAPTGKLVTMLRYSRIGVKFVVSYCTRTGCSTIAGRRYRESERAWCKVGMNSRVRSIRRNLIHQEIPLGIGTAGFPPLGKCVTRVRRRRKFRRCLVGNIALYRRHFAVCTIVDYHFHLVTQRFEVSSYGRVLGTKIGDVVARSRLGTVAPAVECITGVGRSRDAECTLVSHRAVVCRHTATNDSGRTITARCYTYIIYNRLELDTDNRVAWFGNTISITETGRTVGPGSNLITGVGFGYKSNRFLKFTRLIHRIDGTLATLDSTADIK